MTNINGTFIKKLDANKFGQEFIISVYKGKKDDKSIFQPLKFIIPNDKADVLNNISEKEHISVDFSIKGNEWEGKYYVELIAFNVYRKVNIQKKNENPSSGTDLPW